MAFDKALYIKMIAEGKGKEAAKLINKQTAGTNKTTSGVVASGQMDAFKKDIASGGTGSQYVTGPATYQKSNAPASAKAIVKAPIVQPKIGGVANVAPSSTTDLKSQIVDKQKSAAMGRFKAAFEQTQGRLGQEGANLTTATRGKIGQARVADTMARKGSEKMRATQGKGASGSASQSNIAQNVIGQGAESAIGAQETALRADIERRMTEAQSMRDQGIATAETEADLINLTNQLAQLEQADADNKVKEAQTKSDYLTTIGRFAGDYMAEINRVKNDGDVSNDWQVPFL